MVMHAKATFRMKQWEEKTLRELGDGQKVTLSVTGNIFSGDIQGESTLEYLSFYRSEGDATFVGLEHIRGRIGEREGSFALQHTGVYEGQTAKVTWTVVPGSGTGALKGLQGKGGFSSGHADAYAVTLEYDFDGPPASK